jgi:hypothetical protein
MDTYEQIGQLIVRQTKYGIVVAMETETKVVSFCLSEDQRNRLVYDLLNPEPDSVGWPKRRVR